MTGTPDYYDTLGVTPDADPATIKSAYRKIMLQHHPDVATSPASHDIAAAAAIAYATLSVPDLRAAYDTHGADPDEPDPADHAEPFADQWGDESNWTPPPLDEDPAPASAPTSRPARRRPPKPAKEPPLRLRYPARSTALVGAVTAAALIVLVALASASAPLAMLTTPALKVAAVAVAAVAGLIAAARVKMRHVSLWACATVAVVAVVWLARVVPAAWAVAGHAGQALCVTFAGMLFVLQRQRSQRALNQVLPLRSLKRHNLFGSLPGGVAADLLDQALQPFGAAADVRILRAAQSGWSHAVVSGTKVVLVSSILAGPGLYRWSGPSLIRDDESLPFPVEVLNAAVHLAALRAVSAAAGKGVEVRGWLLVHTRAASGIVGTAGAVSVASAEHGVTQIDDFLADGHAPLVDQETVVAVARSFSR